MLQSSKEGSRLQACLRSATLAYNTIVHTVERDLHGTHVYTLTFVVFTDHQPSVKVSSRKNLDQSGNESVFVRRLHHKNSKMVAIR